MQKKIFLGDYRPNIIKNCLTVNAVRQFCLFSRQAVFGNDRRGGFGYGGFAVLKNNFFI